MKTNFKKQLLRKFQEKGQYDRNKSVWDSRFAVSLINAAGLTFHFVTEAYQEWDDICHVLSSIVQR